MSKKPVLKEKPLAIFIRLYEPATTRMRAVCQRFSTDHNAIAMAGTLAEMARLENSAGIISPEDSRAIQEARRLGLDPLEILTAAAAAKLSTEATFTP